MHANACIWPGLSEASYAPSMLLRVAAIAENACWKGGNLRPLAATVIYLHAQGQTHHACARESGPCCTYLSTTGGHHAPRCCSSAASGGHLMKTWCAYCETVPGAGGDTAGTSAQQSSAFAARAEAKWLMDLDNALWKHWTLLTSLCCPTLNIITA